MLSRRLRDSERCPSAAVIAVGFVESHRLTLDKVSTDGSGKCDIEKTETKSDRTYGALFEIDPAEKPALDKAEGLNHGYKEGSVQVVTDGGVRTAMTYVATKKEAVLKPYRWYKALVVAGAVEHSLPASYIEWLRAINSQEDPNPSRRAKHERFLFAS